MVDRNKSKTSDETPRQAFTRLAQARTGKVIAAVSSLEQLARPANYEYTPEDWTKIKGAIDGALATCMTAAQTGKIVKDAGFKL